MIDIIYLSMVFNSVLMLSGLDVKKRNMELNLKLTYSDDDGDQTAPRLHMPRGFVQRVRGPRTEDSYIYYKDGKGSYKFHETMVNWTIARDRCLDEGAELASPETTEILKTLTLLIRERVRRPLRVFTGINDLYAKGFLNSIKGVPLEQMPVSWAPGEPRYILTDHTCLLLNPNGDLTVDKCSDTAAYICYKSEETANEVKCGAGYKFFQKTAYCYKLHTEKSDWQQSYVSCRREGGWLLAPTSDTEAAVGAALFGKHYTVYLGATAWEPFKLYTIFGASIRDSGYSNWAPGEPNNYQGKQFCMSMENLMIYDDDCDKKYLFICKRNRVDICFVDIWDIHFMSNETDTSALKTLRNKPAGDGYFYKDLNPEQRNDRKFGLEIQLKYGGKGRGVQVNKNVRQGGSGAVDKIDGEWDSQGYIYHARAKGSFKLHSNLVPWLDARLKCYEEGAELASPESEVLLETISSIMISATIPPLIVYTGINDLYARGIFTSIRGIPLAHMPVHWKSDHTNMGRHNCLSLHHNGLLNGEACTAKRQFICHKRDQKMHDTLCGPDYILYKTTHTCYKYHTATAIWSDAYATCAREEGRLLVVDTDDEAELLTAVFKKPRETAVHLGATRWKLDVYMTIDGDPVNSKRMFGYKPTFEESAVPKSQPYDKFGCLMLQNEFFHKVNCTTKYPFVCERTPNQK